jgi:hypothetical protein
MKKTEISIENKPPQNLHITSQDLTSSVKIHASYCDVTVKSDLYCPVSDCIK